MSRTTSRLFCGGAVLAAIVMASHADGLLSAADASTIQIHFTNLQLSYDGTNIYDSSVLNTVRPGDASGASPLAAVDFFLDGTLVGSLPSLSQPGPVFADVFIKNVLNIPAAGGQVTSGGNGDTFGVDLLTGSSSLVALNLDTAVASYLNFGLGLNISFQGGVASSLASQSLPFGLVADPNQPVTFSFTSSSMSVTPSGGFLAGFTSTGTGTITMTAVPEPATSTLAIVGGVLASSAFAVRRRIVFSRNVAA